MRERAGAGRWIPDRQRLCTTSAAIGTPLPVASAGVGRRFGLRHHAGQVLNAKAGNSLDGGLDSIETYTSNAGGLLYHGNGVWQYNWQTPKSLAGQCFSVKLDPISLNGVTDFLFSKSRKPQEGITPPQSRASGDLARMLSDLEMFGPVLRRDATMGSTQACPFTS